MSYDSIKIHRKQQNIRRKFEARDLVDRLKSGPCVDCGNSYHACQMDFFRPDKETSLISRILIKSKSTILREIRKCVLLCANCSRLRVYKNQRQKRSDKLQ